MSNNKQTAKQCAERLMGRDPYAAPTLKEFGAVGALTQSGTAGQPEGMMMFMDADRQPMG